jgi:hypothetical protein
VATVVYVLNRSPTKSLDGVTPYEAWHGKKPRVDHLRIFGCIGHVKRVGPGVRKLSDRSQKMVLIGYEEGTKGYRLLDPVSKKLHISRDVIFEEDQAWNWEKETVEQTQLDQFIVEYPVTYGNPTTEQTATDSVPGSLAVGSPDQNQFQPSPGSYQGSIGTHTPSASSSAAPMNVEWATPPQGQSADSEGVPLRYRTLNELFDQTDEVEDFEYSGLCLLAADEPISESKLWRKHVGRMLCKQNCRPSETTIHGLCQNYQRVTRQ